MAEFGAIVGGHGPTLRLDKFLWFVRLARSRPIAQKMAEAGLIRINGRRIDRSHAPVRGGDLITFPKDEEVRVVRVLSLPQRRGAAPEAQSCYEEIRPGDGTDKPLEPLLARAKLDARGHRE